MTTERAAEAPTRTLDTEAERVLALMVAGGIVSADKVEEARELARSLSPQPARVVLASDFDRLREQAEGLRTERDALRAALMELFPADEGFTEAFDTLVARGLLTEVPANEEFRAEYESDTMFMWTWLAASYRADTPAQEGRS